jgi:predicted CopG family antitoxin
MEQIQRIKELKNKHLVISEKNYQKLKNIGKMGETFDDVLTKILAKEPGVYEIDVTKTT